MEIKSMLMPAAGVGVLIGIIGAIPLVNLCNICCLWILIGGFLAAYMYGRKARVEMADGAVIGVLFGGVYGIVVSIANFIVSTVMNMLGLGLSMAGGTEDALSQFGFDVGTSILGMLLGFVINVILGVIFGAIGGVIYAATVGKK